MIKRPCYDNYKNTSTCIGYKLEIAQETTLFTSYPGNVLSSGNKALVENPKLNQTLTIIIHFMGGFFYTPLIFIILSVINTICRPIFHINKAYIIYTTNKNII